MTSARSVWVYGMLYASIMKINEPGMTNLAPVSPHSCLSVDDARLEKSYFIQCFIVKAKFWYQIKSPDNVHSLFSSDQTLADHSQIDSLTTNSQWNGAYPHIVINI